MKKIVPCAVDQYASEIISPASTVEVYVDENGEVYKVEDECAVCLGGGNI